LWILLLCITGVHGAQKPSLFPLQEGNVWILEAANGEERIVRCEAGTNGLLQVTGLTEFDVTLFGRPFTSKLYRWEAARNKFRRTMSLKSFKRRSSAFRIGDALCDQLLLELEPADAVIRTTTGEYSNCSTLWITAEDPLAFVCREILSERIWFAPGVGPVLIQGRLDRIFLLVAAQVGDEPILPEQAAATPGLNRVTR
jgi:hypothetical protein